MKSSATYFESSKFIFCLAAFLFCSSTFAKPLFSDTAYVHTYGGKNMDVGQDIQYTSDHGFIIAGTTSSFGSGNTAIYLLKVDSNGTYQWSKAIGGIGIEWGYSVKQTFDKGYVVAGYTNSFGNGGYDMYLVKTDSVGNILWEKTYGGKDWDFAYCVQQTSDSGFVLCGETYSYGNGKSDAYIVKTNRNGDTLWTRAIGGANTDIAHSIALLNDSTYAIAGETTSFGIGGSDVYFISIEKNGNHIITKTFGTILNDKGYWIEKISDGGMVIAGETDSDTLAFPPPGNTRIKGLTLKLSPISSNDTVEWVHTFNNLNNGTMVCNAVKEKSNGDLLTCGNSNPSGSGGSGLQMLMLNSGGWWSSGPAFGGVADEKGNSLVITPKREVVFIGSTTSYGQGLEDVYLVKLKSDSLVMSYILNINQFNDTLLSPLSVQEFQSEENVLIYPNPFAESATLNIENWQKLNSNVASLKIYDVTGRELYRTEIKNQKSEINRNTLNAGMYFFTVTSSDEIVYKGKFVIQ